MTPKERTSHVEYERERHSVFSTEPPQIDTPTRQAQIPLDPNGYWVLISSLKREACWFAYVSETEDCLLEDVLVAPPHSLAKQVHSHYLPKLLSHDPDNITNEHEISARNRLFNVDGFGVAYYTPVATSFNSPTTASQPHLTGQRPALYKNSQPPLHDTNFRSLCANTSSTAVFAHIRAATATPITSVNNHPFVFGRHTIMHNGSIANFISICRPLISKLDDDTYANIKGSTDSEHFAALYISHLTHGRGKSSWEEEYSIEAMQSAMRIAIHTVVDLQRKQFGDEAQANSLNVCATDGRKLLAVRVRNHATEQPPSLYWSTKAGVTLNRKYPGSPDDATTSTGTDSAEEPRSGSGGGGKKKSNPAAYKRGEEHGKHIIVASEPSTFNKDEWDVIEKNCTLLVDERGRARCEKLELPREWNALAASTVGDGGAED